MYRVAIIGDYDSVYGFAVVGFDTFPVKDVKEAQKKLHSLANSEYPIIYITEALATELAEDIAKYKERITPAIIMIPGTKGNTGAGVDGVKKFVEKAVGSDILFGQK